MFNNQSYGHFRHFGFCSLVKIFGCPVFIYSAPWIRKDTEKIRICARKLAWSRVRTRVALERPSHTGLDLTRAAGGRCGGPELQQASASLVSLVYERAPIDHGQSKMTHRPSSTMTHRPWPPGPSTTSRVPWRAFRLCHECLGRLYTIYSLSALIIRVN